VAREAFDVDGYLAANPDVAEAMRTGAFGSDPYQHYLQYGFAEGRPGATRPATPATPGTPGPVNTTGFKTSGYANPAFLAPNPGAVLPGWDATKWADPLHQTPKYAVGRILSQFPTSIAGLTSAFAQIKQAYPGATYDGKDKITIPGVGTIDVLVGASQGGTGWAWQDSAAAQGQGAGSVGPAGLTLPSHLAMDNTFQPVGGVAPNQQDIQAVIAQILAQILARQ